jgi:hypothetical protein
VPIWDVAGNRRLVLRPVPAHLVPRDRAVYRPSDWSMLMARSYVRHLCREHGAVKGELIRHTFDPVPPAVLFLESPNPAEFGELVSNFGEVTR